MLEPASTTPEPTFADAVWPQIKANIDASMFNLDTSKAGVEHGLKLAADVAVDQWKLAAEAENRDALAQKLGERAFGYDTDHNPEEWAECLELADLALSLILESGSANA